MLTRKAGYSHLPHTIQSSPGLFTRITSGLVNLWNKITGRGPNEIIGNWQRLDDIANTSGISEEEFKSQFNKRLQAASSQQPDSPFFSNLSSPSKVLNPGSVHLTPKFSKAEAGNFERGRVKPELCKRKKIPLGYLDEDDLGDEVPKDIKQKRVEHNNDGKDNEDVKLEDNKDKQLNDNVQIARKCLRKLSKETKKETQPVTNNENLDKRATAVERKKNELLLVSALKYQEKKFDKKLKELKVELTEDLAGTFLSQVDKLRQFVTQSIKEELKIIKEGIKPSVVEKADKGIQLSPRKSSNLTSPNSSSSKKDLIPKTSIEQINPNIFNQSEDSKDNLSIKELNNEEVKANSCLFNSDKNFILRPNDFNVEQVNVNIAKEEQVQSFAKPQIEDIKEEVKCTSEPVNNAMNNPFEAFHKPNNVLIPPFSFPTLPPFNPQANNLQDKAIFPWANKNNISEQMPNEVVMNNMLDQPQMNLNPVNQINPVNLTLPQKDWSISPFQVGKQKQPEKDDLFTAQTSRRLYKVAAHRK